jgi:hypothetical protein
MNLAPSRRMHSSPIALSAPAMRIAIYALDDRDRNRASLSIARIQLDLRAISGADKGACVA